MSSLVLKFLVRSLTSPFLPPPLLSFEGLCADLFCCAQARWVKTLSKTHPTIAFHASITNSFGKGSLIQLLRQFSSLFSDKKQISVGFVGYPNVGKSSIINTLKQKKVCTVAPIPGETKVRSLVLPDNDNKVTDVHRSGSISPSCAASTSSTAPASFLLLPTSRKRKRSSRASSGSRTSLRPPITSLSCSIAYDRSTSAGRTRSRNGRTPSHSWNRWRTSEGSC